MKKHNTSRLLSGVTKLKKIFTQRVTKNFLVTMTTSIARKEHTENHKQNYKRVKQKLICAK